MMKIIKKFEDGDLININTCFFWRTNTGIWHNHFNLMNYSENHKEYEKEYQELEKE